MKLDSKIFLIFTTIFVLSVSTVVSQTLDEPKLKNQNYTFQNQYESAVMTDQLKTANFTVPQLSRALFEQDPKRKIRMHDFVSILGFPLYRLTRGESEQIFIYADANRDSLLDLDEWETFSGLYLFPFEACDRDQDYLLDEKEFAECFDKDPKSKLVVFRRRDQATKHKDMMEIVSSRVKALINIHDYLFIRRGLFAWRNCQSNAKYIAKTHFKCAIKTALSDKVHWKIDFSKIYDAGVVTISNDDNLIQLDFMNYLRTLYSVYYFAVFGEPLSTPYIEKRNFIKAVREDRLPNNFEEKEVYMLYDLINTNPLIPVSQMNFNSFAFFFNLHKLFNKYSVQRPKQLVQGELLKLLDDKLCPSRTVQALDRSKTNFTESQYQEASLVLQRLRPNERQYFFQFKEAKSSAVSTAEVKSEAKSKLRFKSTQDATAVTASLWDPKTVNATYFNVTKNNANRKVFFTTFAGSDKETWIKADFYRAFQLSNLFTSFLTAMEFTVASAVFVDKLMSQYIQVDPPISLNQRVNYPVYKVFPREVYIDLLTFLAIENYRTKFETFLNGSNQNVFESWVKMVLMDFGMKNMPDTVIDLAKKGYDKLRRRTYDTNEMMKICVLVQSVASEQVRANHFITKYNVKTNKDASRRYPSYSSRQEASPWV
jgi:hypothetical protein